MALTDNYQARVWAFSERKAEDFAQAGLRTYSPYAFVHEDLHSILAIEVDDIFEEADIQRIILRKSYNKEAVGPTS